ncbi:MAG: hypothetical protein MR332_09165 [Fusicatenibacter sp.]|nr:hypothetical protein [Fusicatenibacter sp.]
MEVSKKETAAFPEEKPREVVESRSWNPEYSRYYTSNHDRAYHSDQIIYGQVTDFSCEAGRNFIFTYEKVQIREVLQGDLNVGDTISVVKWSGEVTVREMIDGKRAAGLEEEAAAYEEEYKGKDLDSLVIHDSGYHDIDSEIGQKSVYFLEELDWEDTKNLYARIDASKSQYLEISDGVFESTFDVFKERTDEEDSDSRDASEKPSLYTLEELVESFTPPPVSLNIPTAG